MPEEPSRFAIASVQSRELGSADRIDNCEGVAGQEEFLARVDLEYRDAGKLRELSPAHEYLVFGHEAKP